MTRLTGTCLCLIWTGALAQAFGPDVPAMGGEPFPLASTAARARYDGNQFFATYAHDGTLYGVHLGPDARPIEQTPIAIATNVYTQHAMALGSGVHLVVWVDGYSTQVRFARVSYDGTVLDPGGVVLPGATPADRSFAVAENAGTFLIVWGSQYAGVSAARIAPNGAILDAIPIAIGTTGSRPCLTSADGKWLVVWPDATNSNAAQIDAFGNVTNLGTVTSFPASDLAVATVHGVAQLLVLGANILAQRIDEAGNALDPQPIAAFPAVYGYPGYQYASAAFDGTTWWVVASGGAPYTIQTALVRISDSGALLDAMPRVFDSREGGGGYLGPALAYDGSHMIALYLTNEVAQHSTQPEHAMGALFDSSATMVGTPVFVSAALESATGPILMPDDGGLVLAARSATTVDPSRNYRLSTDPKTLIGYSDADGGFALIGHGYFVNAYDYFVGGINLAIESIWNDPGSSFYGADLGPGHSPAGASSSSDAVVVWSTGGDLDLRRFDFQGPYLEAATATISHGNAADTPAIAVSTHFVIAWVENGAGGHDVWGTFSPDAGDATEGPPFAIAATTDDELSPAVGATTGSALVVYEARSDAGFAIRARFVEPNLGAVITLAESPTGLHHPTVAAIGDYWAAAWERDNPDGGDGDIDGVWMSMLPGGQLWLRPVEIAHTASDERSPALALDNDQVTVAFQRWLPADGVWQIVLRTAGTPHFVQCASAADCPSGFCVDGVCCNSACGGGAVSGCSACARDAGATDDGVCTIFATGKLCRAADGACDQAEACDGVTPACPADARRPEDAICDDGNSDTHGDRCVSGVCKGELASVCAPGVTCGAPAAPIKKTRCGCSSADSVVAAALLTLRLLRRGRRRRA